MTDKTDADMALGCALTIVVCVLFWVLLFILVREALS